MTTRSISKMMTVTITCKQKWWAGAAIRAGYVLIVLRLATPDCLAEWMARHCFNYPVTFK